MLPISSVKVRKILWNSANVETILSKMVTSNYKRCDDKTDSGEWRHWWWRRWRRKRQRRRRRRWRWRQRWRPSIDVDDDGEETVRQSTRITKAYLLVWFIRLDLINHNHKPPLLFRLSSMPVLILFCCCFMLVLKLKKSMKGIWVSLWNNIVKYLRISLL